MLLEQFNNLLQEPDHYKVLGVNTNASLNEIKIAYRQRALACHPDRLPSGQKEFGKSFFQRVSNAYETLSDPIKRENYDTYPESSNSSQQESNPNDLFEQFCQECLKKARDPNNFTVSVKSANQVISDIKLLVQSIIEKPRTKWIGGYRYQAVSEVAQELLNEINTCESNLLKKPQVKNTHTYEQASFTHSDFHEFLLCVQIAVGDAQRKNVFNTHRGYLRTTPIFREITLLLQILAQFIVLCLYKIYENSPFYNGQNELKYGLFTPPNTTTQQKIDILMQELKADLREVAPNPVNDNGEWRSYTTKVHINLSPGSSLTNWSNY